jgi:hypothetical protein
LDIIGSTKKKKIYAMFSPRAVIEMEKKIKVAALLDIKADVNVMTVKVADAVNLFILEIIPIKVEIFTGHNAQLIRICREINI